MKYFRFILLILFPVLIAGQGTDNHSSNNVAKRFYAKVNILMGVGFDKVHSSYKLVKGEDIEKINIYPGGGIGAEVALGYDISSNIAAEIGIGTQFSGESLSNGHVYFRKVPFRISGIYRLKTKKLYTMFFGGGTSFDLSPKWDVEIDDDDAKVTYSSNVGFHGLFGLDFFSPKSPLYFAGEIRYVGMPDYEKNQAPRNFISPSDISTLSASGVHFVFTMGYYFK
jgi:hypothetical protein